MPGAFAICKGQALVFNAVHAFPLIHVDLETIVPVSIAMRLPGPTLEASPPANNRTAAAVDTAPLRPTARFARKRSALHRCSQPGRHLLDRSKRQRCDLAHMFASDGAHGTREWIVEISTTRDDACLSVLILTAGQHGGGGGGGGRYVRAARCMQGRGHPVPDQACPVQVAASPHSRRHHAISISMHQQRWHLAVQLNPTRAGGSGGYGDDSRRT
eukprot:6196708-Pleurochrysis_carterae.AAC.3